MDFVHPIDMHDEHPGEEFIDRRRRDLNGYLDLVRTSNAVPWRKLKNPDRVDMGKAFNLHRRLNGMSRWLPREEGQELRKAYWYAMDRLYELENIGTPLVPMMDFPGAPVDTYKEGDPLPVVTYD